ncbi:MAG: Mrp/NBP35 family ATP-binding protein [Candidatus Symbiothrix sp.]|jgi:ATP-binding protein involved in chromosome partitioning|nr:Mrp/NBP35 family ATP-binding protein [Candidatus Symbiothrix sp.]
MTLYPKLITDALEKVRYPGTGKNIVESGMVADNIRIEGNKVSLSLILTRVNDPFAKSLVKASETAILTYVSPDINIKGNITIQIQPLGAPLAGAQQTNAQQTPEKSLPQVKNTIAISSGKGGVGKSTISANLAVALVQLGYKVGLLDADIYGPSIPKMFGEEDAKPYMEEVEGRERIVPIEKYGVKLLSIGFFVNANDALIWRSSMASNALKQLITDANWGELDYFIIDLPPGTGDIHLTLIQSLNLTGGIVVTTPQDVALAAARKGISLFQNAKLNVPILGLVENMAWFTPAELPDNKYYIFGKDGGKKLAQELNIPFLGEIPLVQSVCEAGDSGQPVALNPDSIMGQAFLQLAEKLIP